MKDAFELEVGCSPDGMINTHVAPLFALRGIRDRQVDVLRLYLRDLWDDYWDDLDTCLADLVEQHDLRCLAALEENAARDRSGRSLVQLETVKKLCRIVGRRERAEWERATNQPF